MAIEVIRDPGSAAPIGPYSQGIKAGGFVFVAGEKGIDPATGEIVEGGIEAETRQTLENVKGILAAWELRWTTSWRRRSTWSTSTSSPA